ncbi:hypothetical protein Rsub_11706 [Raphidocelis subcapitata]|uniref:Activator of Hsp90 ATPase AHSA1-like N-terminal domain-containing protein n=1 Tax=Raphidocelis subcapitata TaxID=307507 RepID=A0A2V0PGE0_9CHLO|nr:hypothetical protein Rsub_11706 [Raphidocelis subcapitata]|eukprot:GBF98914.1 hypothetical protein Rsub_11706 [Raphidocelis subcapitata]
MAKFDEADPRWIVANRDDGTNVNAWHWSSKDCLAWSRRRLGELFESATLLDSPRIVATGLDSLEGEAFLNNRKAKLIASYELKMAIGWKGTTADGREASGVIELPYLADENDDEETEVRVVVADDSGAAGELRNALLRQGGREAVRKLVDQFVSELKAGAPLKAGKDDATGGVSNGDAAAASGAPSSNGAGSKAAGSGRAAGASGGSAAATAKGGSAASSRSRLNLEQQFYCRPVDLFECFTVEARLRAFTQSPATADPRPGGAFSWFGGGVTGTFVELQAPSRLALDWRFSSWEEGVCARVEIALSEPEPGSTTLVLAVSGVPEEDRFGNHDVGLQVEKGWEEQVFKRIRQVFGYGA